MSALNPATGFHSLSLCLRNASRPPAKPLSAVLAPSGTLIHPFTPRRTLHETIPQKPVPRPTPFVPDTKTFLKLIGRKMSRFAPKLESWDQMFSMSSKQLRDNAGMAIPRERRYLMRWLERFRQGRYGFGGDFDHVVDGVAELKVVSVPEQRMPGYLEKMESMKKKQTTTKEPTKRDQKAAAKKPGVSLTITPGMRYAIVNVPSSPPADLTSLPIKKYDEVKLQDGYMIQAPYIDFVKAGESGVHGMHARIAVHEGMWEDKRGQKVGGGERRRRETRLREKREALRKAVEEASGISKG